MADYLATARSNTFRVKDVAAFTANIKRVAPDIAVHTRGENKVCMLAESDHGTWPTSIFDPNTDEFAELDWPEILKRHMQEGEVCIIMEASNEKLRYVGGWAWAIHSNGDRKRISLNDIYDIAANAFGVPADQITDCAY